MRGKNIAIVGSGLGGLSAAAYLKDSGHRVTVFEKNDFPGGKISEIASDGFRFDTGPTLITMPHVLRELFENFSDSEIPELIPIEPLNRNFFPDGTRLDTYSNFDKMVAEISKISPEDSKNFRRFYNYSKKIYDKSAQIFLHEPVHEVRKLIAEKKFPPLTDFLQIDSMRTVHKAVSSFFENEKIIQIFDRYPTYNGSDPFKAPATLNIIPYVEFGFGGWYVKGGIYRLVENLVNNLVNSGVEFRFHSEVNKIVHRNGRVTGIDINGKSEEFDVVISNSDVVNTFEKLIDDFPGKRKKLQKMEPSISGMVFLWGVEGEFPELEHHNVFFSENYKLEFDTIFNKNTAPGDPTIYVAITSKSDKTHAPAGHENWFVLVNMPYDTGQDWETLKQKTRESILDKLKRGGFDIERKIKFEHSITPRDLYNRYHTNRGSIYGISSNSKMAAFRRQANRSRELGGLFFAGGSAHPGGGIPLVILSGKHCAGLINHFEPK